MTELGNSAWKIGTIKMPLASGVTGNDSADLTGAVIGRFTVVRRVGKGDGDGAAWLCRCECGVLTVKRGRATRWLREKQCECPDFRRPQKRKEKRERKEKQEKHPLRVTWRGMVYRCHNPKHKSYKYYGGRGISVCAEWRADPDAFYAFIGEKPGPGYSIDRINNDGNYEPGNVRWATHSEQMKNRRPFPPPTETCNAGHLWCAENMYVNRLTGARRCKTCARDTGKRRYQQQKATRDAEAEIARSR